MVDTQTSPMSTPQPNDSYRTSNLGDSLIKLTDPLNNGQSYPTVTISELAAVIAEIIMDRSRPAGCRVNSYIINKLKTRFRKKKEPHTKVNSQLHNSDNNKSHQLDTGSPLKSAAPVTNHGCNDNSPPFQIVARKPRITMGHKTLSKLKLTGNRLKLKTPSKNFNNIKSKLLSSRYGQ